MKTKTKLVQKLYPFKILIIEGFYCDVISGKNQFAYINPGPVSARGFFIRRTKTLDEDE